MSNFHFFAILVALITPIQTNAQEKTWFKAADTFVEQIEQEKVAGPFFLDRLPEIKGPDTFYFPL